MFKLAGVSPSRMHVGMALGCPLLSLPPLQIAMCRANRPAEAADRGCGRAEGNAVWPARLRLPSPHWQEPDKGSESAGPRAPGPRRLWTPSHLL